MKLFSSVSSSFIRISSWGGEIHPNEYELLLKSWKYKNIWEKFLQDHWQFLTDFCTKSHFLYLITQRRCSWTWYWRKTAQVKTAIKDKDTFALEGTWMKETGGTISRCTYGRCFQQKTAMNDWRWWSMFQLSNTLWWMWIYTSVILSFTVHRQTMHE